jgi:hypothetical protein
MAHDDAERFRKQAEQAREHAARAYSPLDKEAWLRVAEEWLKLALSAESGTGSKHNNEASSCFIWTVGRCS